MENNELTQYFSRHSKALVLQTLSRSFSNPKEAAFLIRFGRSVKRANAIRERYEKEGLHVPPFLISSITTSCNLFCKGCYARANGICGKPVRPELSSEDWRMVFQEGERMGVMFNILAGGEPLIRKDVITVAKDFKNTVFPIFTNGTAIDDEYLELFDKNRNLIPIFSLEGGRESTDVRRGEGTFGTVISKMKDLKDNGLFFGVSLTITKDNMNEIMSNDFVDFIEQCGCAIAFYIEFVAAESCLSHLAPDETTRLQFDERLREIRASNPKMIFMSFPGDEKGLGGCLGAGRGFFHINPYGDAEACPASPCSDVNVKDDGLEGALRSRLFFEIRSNGILAGYHEGGCALIEHKEEVSRMVSECAEKHNF